jgi:NAD(P)-dependent dehydrogenase (short-subunit alcohol dehydrogenase family)
VTTPAGRTLLMSGGSRGIGLAIATRAAQDGVTDLDRYRAVPGGGPLETDLFLDPLESRA